MNYLELCQRTARECGVSGTGPTTVLNQIGELSRIINWVATALNDIETAHPQWGWMKRDVSFPTVAGQASYNPEVDCGIATDTFNVWQRFRFRNYVTASGNISEIEMDYITYDNWRDNYSYGATRYVQTRPLEFGIAPDQRTLVLGPYPAAGYTITGEYFRAPQVLAADADIPEMPKSFHMTIVYKAMMYYGMYESAAEVLSRGSQEFDKMMGRLDALKLPDVAWA